MRCDKAGVVESRFDMVRNGKAGEERRGDSGFGMNGYGMAGKFRCLTFLRGGKNVAKKLDEKLDPSLEINLEQRAIDVCILGTTPLIMNRMSEKAKHELIFPSPPKNRVERASRLKHVPLEEFNGSIYRVRENDGATRLVLPSGMFKKCTASAALRMPGANKTEVGQLVRIICPPDSRGPGVNVPVYGLPLLSMAVVRTAGMNKTPDIRTRAILPEWACYLQVGYVYPLLKESMVSKLLAAAGAFIGVGDWRSEKGSGDYGSFEIVPPNDKTFARIVASGGREAQDDAIANPQTYDLETEELLSWFNQELVRRDQKDQATTNGRAVPVTVGADDEEELNNDE